MKNYNKFDNEENDNEDDFDDEENEDSLLFKCEFELNSVDNQEVLVAVANLVQNVIYSFQKRYLDSDNDFEIMDNLRLIKLWTYIYDEFEHVLADDKFKIIRESTISDGDLDEVYRTIVEIIAVIIDRHFEKLEEEDEDDEDEEDNKNNKKK